MTFD
ncbi:hypothetical protein TIFTF001_049527 [Ficus carica]|jgi:hypothetical protein